MNDCIILWACDLDLMNLVCLIGNDMMFAYKCLIYYYYYFICGADNFGVKANNRLNDV